MSERLLSDVRELLVNAEAAYPPGGAAQREVAAALAHLDGPLMVAFAGKVKAGKSTLLNALVGERLAPTDAGECTRLVSIYQHGRSYGVHAKLRDSSTHTLPFERVTGALEVDIGGLELSSIDRLVIDWPSKSLLDITLIDTPGIASISADASSRAMQFLAPGEERATEADAVIYLMRHLHASDRRFLEAFHDQELSQATPVNTVAILSRADEIGVGRLDAMTSARTIAARYNADPQIRRLCQAVIPVAGLIAQAAGTLRQDEYEAFATLAAAPRDQVDSLLVSVDRFATYPEGCGLLPAEREHLLLRFGLYGVRLAVGLLRHGLVDTAAALSAELSKRSGLDDLREILQTLFAERRSVLKSRAALLKVRSVLQRFGDPTGNLDSELERILSNAHEVAELRLLNALRSQQVSFEPEMATKIEQAIGAAGTSVEKRLGAVGDRAALRERAIALVAEWRDAEHHPLATSDQREALQVAIRSIEQLVSELPA